MAKKELWKSCLKCGTVYMHPSLVYPFVLLAGEIQDTINLIEQIGATHIGNVLNAVVTMRNVKIDVIVGFHINKIFNYERFKK
jgi:hypothetical protein